VYNGHRRCSGAGTWVRILDELRRDADVHEGPGWTVGVDSGVVRSHQHAAGAGHAPATDIPADGSHVHEVDAGGRVESRESHAAAQPGDTGPVRGGLTSIFFEPVVSTLLLPTPGLRHAVRLMLACGGHVLIAEVPSLARRP